MLTLPLIPPQDDHSTWLRTSYRPRPDSPPPSLAPQTNSHHHQQHRPRPPRDEASRLAAARSPLALLAADEAAIHARKAAIRNFGAYWIRPPGVAKTLQAMTEEEAEKREQEEIERQERGMADMQAQQQLAEVQARAAETAAGGGDGEDDGENEEEERDLDDEIPEAEVEDTMGDVTGEEERDLDDDIPEAGVEDMGVSFNEESMFEGSLLEVEQQRVYAEMETAELTGAAQEGEDLGLGMEEMGMEERDLDDDVPEAGSYQHTDTEMEDTESELESSEVRDSSAAQSARRSVRTSARVARQLQGSSRLQSAAQTPALGSLQERMRATIGADTLPRSPGSINLSSSILESSFVGSSPMLQRATGNGGGSRGRGAPPRRRGRFS